MRADAVLLIAFGGPTRPEEIRPFLANVVRGRRVPPARLEEVVHHYELIGGRSPLNELTFRQAAALEVSLAGSGSALPVHVGMRNWEPYLATTLTRMADAGSRRAVGVILSPHANEASRERYMATVDDARAALGARAPVIVYVPTWHVHPLFVAAAADRVREALARTAGEARVVFTAHSVPTAGAATYVAELTASAAAIAHAIGAHAWELAYQSRSGSPQESWLEPDVNDTLRTLAAGGVRHAVVAPIGFVCDHVEVLYDLDVEARATAAQLDLGFTRAATVNDHPLFIRMLTEVVRETAS